MLLETPPSLLFFADFWVPSCPSALQVFFFCSVLACLFLGLPHHIDPYDLLICLLYSSLCGLQREPSPLTIAARTSTGSDLLISIPIFPFQFASISFFHPSEARLLHSHTSTLEQHVRNLLHPQASSADSTLVSRI